LPELAGVNIQLMTRSEEELRDVDFRLRSLEQQIVYLDAQLAQISPSSAVYTSSGERVFSPQDRLKFLRTEYARASALYSDTHPDVVRLRREIAGLEKSTDPVDQANEVERQMSDANSQLRAARERYADDHPDVVRLTRLTGSLTRQLEELRTAPPTPAPNANPDNPAFIQIKAQREASVGERDSLNKKRTELQARVRELENRMESAPSVEREYTSLVRELENSQIKYREVRQKQMEAQVSQNLEDGRKGERFTLIEPPIAPSEPASPNRRLILALGAIVGLGGAIGVLLLLEALDGSVRSQRDLASLLRIPPLAVVPWMETHAERALRARRRLISLVGGTAGIALTLILTHWLYRPLDVLWQVALRRLG
jgi:succinoglycan biosynthesis transport protein ExoP